VDESIHAGEKTPAPKKEVRERGSCRGHAKTWRDATGQSFFMKKRRSSADEAADGGSWVMEKKSALMILACREGPAEKKGVAVSPLPLFKMTERSNSTKRGESERYTIQAGGWNHLLTTTTEMKVGELKPPPLALGGGIS